MNNTCCLAVLILVCTGLGGSHATSQAYADLPHVNDCSLCMKCVVDTPHAHTHIRTEDLKEEHFKPSDELEKQTKPICEECRGCTDQLTVLVSSGKKQIFNRSFADEGGASPNWLFVAPTNRTRSKKAIVKVACIPVGKNPVQAHPKCHADQTVQFAKIYLALEKLAEDCELTDITPQVWVEPISAVIPELGFHIRWHAIWMEQAEGISLENVVRLGTPMMHPNQLLDIMHGLNKTQIIMSAIFDLLTSQCDRHAQNIFIDEAAGIMLIDNERALYENQWCGMDSILLPTTKKYTINVMENAWVLKFKDWGNKIPQCWANPPLLLDYRCYVKDGKIGKDWLPGVGRCLKKLHGMTPEAIMHSYGFPNLLTASALKNRSQAMYEHGFEYALTQGYPRNPNPWRYKFVPPCCKIKHTDTYRCAHDWKPDTSLPFGDPIGGHEWKRDSKDPGSYEGGSVF